MSRRRINKHRADKSRYVPKPTSPVDVNGKPYPERHEIGLTRYVYVGRNWTARHKMETAGECPCCIERALGDLYDEEA